MTKFPAVSPEKQVVEPSANRSVFAGIKTLTVWLAIASAAYAGGAVFGVPADWSAVAEALRGEALPSAAVSDAAASTTCFDSASNTIEILACYEAEIAEADRLINDTYDRLMAIYSNSDEDYPGSGELAIKLRAAERAWISYRDTNCETYAAQARGGSLANVLYADCRLDMTRRREEELSEALATWLERGYGG